MRHSKPVRLETAPTVLPFGRHCFQQCRCGAVGNRTYRVGESVYLFLDFTIIAPNLCANCIISVVNFPKSTVWCRDVNLDLQVLMDFQ